MNARRCPGCREYAAGGIRCRACGHRFCTQDCLEAHERGYHGLPPRDPPFWFRAVATATAGAFLFLAGVLGLALVVTCYQTFFGRG
jgi:hypothetical protein